MNNLNARIKVKSDTTANWNALGSFIPLKGEIIVYLDYAQKIINGDTIYIPNFKIGDGLAFLIDLPFVSDDVRNELAAHTTDSSLHVSAEERTFWNNKVNCVNNVIDETLVLNRL